MQSLHERRTPEGIAESFCEHPEHGQVVGVDMAAAAVAVGVHHPDHPAFGHDGCRDVGHSDPVFGGDGRTFVVDVALLPGNDPYVFPDNLPIVAAKGGPGGKPGCGSLPDATKNFPVRQLITNTGWGTGLDIRPNPGIGHPCWANYFPVTRAIPQDPSIRQCIPGPAVGPEPYPGSPPYGAALPAHAAEVAGTPP